MEKFVYPHYNATMKIAVLSPVRNEGPRIARMINSLSSLSKIDYKIFVCDNASDDETRRVVQGLSVANPKINLLSFAKPPLSAYRNWDRSLLWLFKEQNFDYFFPIAGDDYVEPQNFLEILTESLELNHKEIAVPAYFNPRWKNPGRAKRRFGRIGSFRSINRVRMTWCHEYFHMVYSLMTKECFEQCWAFAKKMSQTYEERDWWFVYKMFEFKIIYVSNVSYIHTDEKNATDEGYLSGEYFWPDQTEVLSSTPSKFFKEKTLLANYWKNRELVSSSVILLILLMFSVKLFRIPFIQFIWLIRRSQVKYKILALLKLKRV